MVRTVSSAVAMVIFLAVGLGASWPEGKPASTFLGPSSALQMHADYGAGSSGALPRFVEALAQLPAKKPLLIFHPLESTRGWTAADVLRYLSWPRPVEWSPQAPGADGRSLVKLREQYAGLVLCGAHAPAGTPGKLILGPELEMVVFSEAGSP